MILLKSKFLSLTVFKLFITQNKFDPQFCTLKNKLHCLTHSSPLCCVAGDNIPAVQQHCSVGV